MASTAKNERQTMQSAAYEYIKRKISTCEYAPNQLISESILQQELGMSRTPVREAITRLSQEGLLTVYPKRGILVSGIGLNDINMIYEVRLMIEPHILRVYGNRLDPAIMQHFKDYYSDRIQLPDEQNLYDEDDQFHATILQALPNVYLQDVYSRIQTQNNRLRILTGKTSNERIRNTIREHLAIADACVEQDWEKAAQEMTAHIQSSKEASLSMILQNTNTDITTLLQ